MWMVNKFHRGTETGREPVPAAVFEPLLRWYTGSGSTDDEKIGVQFIRNTRMYERWLACDCLGDEVPPPLMSPAYIAEAQTFYLRRLTGSDRPAHSISCPFHRDQTDYAADRLEPKRIASTVPDGYFAILKPVGEHLAQAPEHEADAPSRVTSTPRLARLLWLLLERAQTNLIEAIGQRPAPSIAREFQRVRNAAQSLGIAPSVPLARWLFTHAEDFRKQRIYARLRAAAASWPAGHEPQAFLLVFARDVGRHEILFDDGEPILVTAAIERPQGPHVSGPYLVLVTIGEHPAAKGYAVVRAYAQPILSGRLFTPVSSDAERTLLAQLLKLQWPLNADGVTSRIKKPLFDIDTEHGPCRPLLMVDILCRRDQLQQMTILQIADNGTDDAAAGTFDNPDALATLGNIAPIAPELLGDLTASATWLTQTLTAKPHSRGTSAVDLSAGSRAAL